MHALSVPLLFSLLVPHAEGHALFQSFWANGADFGSECARLPLNNNPVTNVMSNDIRCNANMGAVAKKCPVNAGESVTVEMHAQPGDRSCGSEAIGGAHHGPVSVYMTKVPDSAKADGSTGWFKIFHDGWKKNPSGGSGDDDHWGTKDLNACCGKMDVKIPDDIAPGDYLLRAEALALHTAGSSGGAQFYMTCYQLTVNGTGTATPPTVSFPGAYKASDPGILVNIHSALSDYVVPGPSVYAGGTMKEAGSACTGCESTCKVGTSPKGSAIAVEMPAGSAGAANGAAACTVGRFNQCGGNGYTGCTKCAEGLTCQAVSPPYYSQCA